MYLVGALENIRVVDFGHFVAGPVAGMLLADQGAEVVKIDPPGGPRFKSEANSTWNRGKRSITLDLKSADDLATARALVARADVLIENFRPGVMEQLGLGESDVRPTNQGLIYNSMPAFGPEDARSAVPGWEGVVLAAADCFRPATDYRDMMQQMHRKPAARAGSPTFTAEPVASMYAAIISALGVASALNLRDRTGEGQRVEIPLFDAVIQSAGVYAMAQLPFKPTFGSAMNPWDHQYKCSDGRWIQLDCSKPDHAAALSLLLDRPDFIERRMTNRRLPDTATEHELILTLTGLFGTKPAQQWEEELSAQGLPAAVCRSSAEWLEHRQAVDAGLFVEVNDQTLGATRQPAALVELSESTPTIDRTAPLPDQNRAEILNELTAPTPTERQGSPVSAILGPLQGIRVLDLGAGLAGPACGRTLAELGAQVIKIDNPDRDGVLYHNDVNRGKRSILLNLDDDEGHDLFWHLLGTADVVIGSSRPSEAREWAVDYETIHAERPDIVYVSVSPYDTDGPLSDLAGSDETVQALTGMQVRYGGMEKPAVWPFGMITSYATGYAAAFGVVLALIERDRGNGGQRIDASLAKTAGVIQSMFLIDHDNKEWSEPAGPMALGFGPTQSLYRCDDGWIYLGADSPEQLEPILGAGVPESELGVGVAEWCEQRSGSDAVEELIKHGLGAHKLTWLNDAMSDPVVVRRGLSVVREQGSIGLLRTTGPGPWFSRSMVATGSPAGTPGADAASILAEINRHGDVDELARTGVIQLPDQS